MNKDDCGYFQTQHLPGYSMKTKIRSKEFNEENDDSSGCAQLVLP
jgi:hypothetical protein